jgi:hypothetical protein
MAKMGTAYFLVDLAPAKAKKIGKKANRGFQEDFAEFRKNGCIGDAKREKGKKKKKK